MDNIYLIHLKKDIGRLEYIKDFLQTINPTIWDGIDNRKYDNGFFLDYKNKKKGTIGCTNACLNLLQYFYNNNKSDYIVIFEDDIILHKYFIKYFKRVIKFIESNSDWKLIYLGTSSPNPDINNNSLTLISTDHDNVYTGGFGIIINKSVIPIIIDKCKKNISKPHDIYAYGFIQHKYPDDCFITIPNLVLADVGCSNIRKTRKLEIYSSKVNWNISDYIIPDKYIMFVLCNNNLKRFENFIDIVSVFQPKIKIVYIKIDQNDDNYDNDNNIKNLINKINKSGDNIEYIDSFSSLKLLRICKKYVSNNNPRYFIMTNIYINWTIPVVNIFQELDKYDKSILIIKSTIYKCWKCSDKKVIHGLRYFQGFTFINKIALYKNLSKLSSKFRRYMKCNFYTTNCCKKIGNNFHSVSKQDLIDDLNNIVFLPYNQLVYEKNNWIKKFINWCGYYFIQNINDVIGLNIVYIDNKKEYELNINNSLRKKFDTPKFRLLRFSYKIKRYLITINFGKRQLLNIFDNKMDSLKDMINEINFTVKFKFID